MREYIEDTPAAESAYPFVVNANLSVLDGATHQRMHSLAERHDPGIQPVLSPRPILSGGSGTLQGTRAPIHTGVAVLNILSDGLCGLAHMGRR